MENSNKLSTSCSNHYPIILANDGRIIYTEGMPIVFECEERVIYTDGEYCYKLFKKINPKHLIQKRLKLLLHYKDILGKQYLIPNMLYTKSPLFAYRTKYLQNAIPFAASFSDDILYLAKEVDFLLFRFHQFGFVFGDFHFNNVLLDQKNLPYFIDFDNIGTSSFSNLFTSASFYKVTRAFQLVINQDYIVSQTTDKISFYLSLLGLYFNKPFLEITPCEVEDSLKVNPLFSRIYYLLIDWFSKEIFEVPYFHELLEEKDYNLLLK